MTKIQSSQPLKAVHVSPAYLTNKNAASHLEAEIASEL
jgi:hypothetical protein